MNTTIEKEVYLCRSYDRKNSPWTINYKTGVVGYVDEGKGTMVPVLNCLLGTDYYSEFLDVMEVEGKLFFLPNHPTRELALRVYDLGTKENIEVSLETLEIIQKNMREPLFSGMIRNGDYLFCMGYAYPAIVRVNVNTYQLDYMTCWQEYLKKLPIESSGLGYFASRQYVIEHNSLFVPFSCNTAVLKIDLDSLQEEVIYIDVISGGFSCICQWDEERFLLTGAGENSDWLYLWNIEKNVVERKWEMQKTPNDLSVTKMLLSDDGRVFLFPWQNWGNYDVDIYCLNQCDGTLVKMGLIDKKEEYIWGDSIIYAEWIDSENMIFLSGTDFVCHNYNIVSKAHYKRRLLIDKDSEGYLNTQKEYYRELSKLTPLYEKDISKTKFMELVFDGN